MTPKYDESQHRRYVNCLRNALYEQNCKSVALSGSYGSGKSSILEQFIKEAKEDGHSVAKVSLATFNVDPYYVSHPYYYGVCPSCINCSIFAATQWHMNWGWYGTSNGWYAASPYSIGDYDSLMHAYTNIRP